MQRLHEVLRPLFSIVISVFNRPKEISRCIDSCLHQTLHDFELIIVDDASTDDTVETIKSYQDKRLHLFQHHENQGMSATRATGFENAQGLWIIRIDSDHALIPTALETLKRTCDEIPDDIGVIGARYLWDNGWVTPPDFPTGAIDYVQRIKWSERGTDNDYVHCYRAQVVRDIPWPIRKGSTNALMELNVAKNWNTLMVSDCLGLQYTDAENSFHRSRRDAKLAQRMQNATDQANTYQEILDLHGSALREHAPKKYGYYCLMAGFYFFLAGQRIKGKKYTLEHLKRIPFSIQGWIILLAGVIGIPVLRFFYLFKGKLTFS